MGDLSVVYLGWVEVILSVPHRRQAPFLVDEVSPRFKISAPNHQDRDIEGGALW